MQLHAESFHIATTILELAKSPKDRFHETIIFTHAPYYIFIKAVMICQELLCRLCILGNWLVAENVLP